MRISRCQLFFNEFGLSMTFYWREIKAGEKRVPQAGNAPAAADCLSQQSLLLRKCYPQPLASWHLVFNGTVRCCLLPLAFSEAYSSLSSHSVSWRIRYEYVATNNKSLRQTLLRCKSLWCRLSSPTYYEPSSVVA